MDDARLRAEDLERFITSIDVYDAEYDVDTWTNVGEYGIGSLGELVVTDLEGRTMVVYAPGSWRKLEVSRAPRLELTGDADDNDGENDATATERDTHLPRDGA